MAWTQSDVDALKAAIASGAKDCTYSDGSRIVYRSLDEMRQILAMAEVEVAGSGVARTRIVRIDFAVGFLMNVARTRVRLKGTPFYFEQMAASAAVSSPGQSGYTTTGFGRRSLALRAPALGPNAALDYAAPQLRDQSRDAVRKDGLAAAIPDRLVSNMVGTGIVPQPPSAKARALWARWTDEASADGTLDLYGQQAQAARAMVVGGEAFVRLRPRRPSDGLTVPLQIQVLEGDFVPFDKNELLPTGGFIRQGIEFDAIGRRTAYWMYPQHPSDATLGVVDATPRRVPATEVLHVYDAISRPGQIRGEPWMTRTLATLKDFADYRDAERVRKKTAALFAVFIRRNLPEGLSAQDLKELWGDDAEIEDGVGSAVLEPGTAQYLEPGESVEFSSPVDVGGQYEVFMREQKRDLAAAAGILYEQLSGDYSQLNDRTWRAAVNEFKRRCEMWQHSILVFQLCRPVWARWAALAVLGGLLTDAEAPAIVKWVPQAWPYINPQQDIEAQETEIRIGLGSRSQKASERGLDAAEIDREQAADNARADALGVKYDSDGRNAKAAKPAAAAAAAQAAGAEPAPAKRGANGKGRAHA